MEDARPLRAVTCGVVPLRLCVTRRLTRCRCLPFLLASQTALTPSANPLGKPGLHHAHLPLLHGRAMASQAGRVAAPPADPRFVMPADVSAQAQSRFQAYARGTKPSVPVTFRSVVMGEPSEPSSRGCVPGRYSRRVAPGRPLATFMAVLAGHRTARAGSRG